MIKTFKNRFICFIFFAPYKKIWIDRWKCPMIFQRLFLSLIRNDLSGKPRSHRLRLLYKRKGDWMLFFLNAFIRQLSNFTFRIRSRIFCFTSSISLARPGCTTPQIRFLYVALHLWIGLPPDPASRRRPCPSSNLRLRENLVQGLSPC